MHSLAFTLIMSSAFTPASTGTAAEARLPLHGQPLTVAQTTVAPAPAGELSPPPTAPGAVAPVPAPAPEYVTPPQRQAAPATRDLSIWGVLPYEYGGFGYGIGGRVALPLPIPSLLPPGNIRDSWSIEFGADYIRFSLGYLSSDYSVNWLLPVVGVRWNVWLSDKFAVYPKAEAGYEIAWVSGYPSGYGSPSYGGVFIDGAAGLLYKIGNGNLTLRAEAGSFGLKGGIGAVF
jgi:hypothetical protein